MVDQELRIQTHTYDLLKWLLPKSERFPRAYRSTIVQRAMDSALDLHEHLIAARAGRGAARVAALRDADKALQSLRVYLRLFHEWRWLSSGQYEHVSRVVNEIGRMLGAWIASDTRSQ